MLALTWYSWKKNKTKKKFEKNEKEMSLSRTHVQASEKKKEKVSKPCCEQLHVLTIFHFFQEVLG